MKRVVLGFSGGIDSYAAINVLREQGYEVIALTLDTIGDQPMIESSRRRANDLGVEHIVVDVREEFRRTIINYFIEEYMHGRTPAPCTICNSTIKWRILKEYAEKLHCDHIATGHYFNIIERDGRKYISRAADPTKDQSYYLWGLTQDILNMALTPMGDMIKRDIVSALPTEKKIRESMGVCFLKGRWYGELLKEHYVDRIVSGDIVNQNGEIIGRHDGYPLYTIGQKKGLNCPTSGCVIKIDVKCNQLILGNQNELYHNNLIVKEFNIVDINELVSSNDVSVMIRGYGKNPIGYAHVSLNQGSLKVELDDPAWALSVGQPVVFYRKNVLLGGGILENYF